MAFAIHGFSLSAIDYDFENLGSQESTGNQSESTDKKKISQKEIFEFFQQSDKVTTASKFAQNIFETPGNVISVQGSEILKQGFFDLNEAMYYQAGFFPSQGDERRTIGSRGLFEDWNNTHYLLLIDGIPYNDNTDGSAHTWESTPLSFIKSLEIIRGPGSALYGSNATNGVISINTYSGQDLNGKIDIRTRFGSLNTLRTDVLTGNATQDWQYVFGGSFFSTDGNIYASYDDFLNSGRQDADGNGIRSNTHDNRRAQYFFLKLQGTQSLENLMLQIHHQSFKFGTFDGWDFQIPDEQENNLQQRMMVQLGYKSPPSANFGQEYTLRYQNYVQQYDLRLGPDGAYGGQYPDGIREYLDTNVQDIFSRVQFSFALPLQMNFLFGSENTLFYYAGDKEHRANFDPNTSDYFPFIDGIHPDVAPGEQNFTRELPPFLQAIQNKPVLRTSGYAQFFTGNLLSKHVQMTLGGRYDRFSAKYTDTQDASDVNLVFQNISPRLALVFLPLHTLSFKALAGQAFRDPALIELFSANSWVAASNPKELKPERITTGEFIAMHQIAKPFRYQVGAFYTKFENLISYSPSGLNLLTNLYTVETVGGEVETILQLRKLRFTMGYAFAKRLSESVADASLTPSDELTEAPAHSYKATLSYEIGPILLAGRVMYQGEIMRRQGDIDIVPYGAYRPTSIPAFTEVAARILYQPGEQWQAGIEMKNILNSEQYIILAGDHAHDYRREMRTVYAFFRLFL